MADIYLIYAKEDRNRVAKLFEFFSQTWSVWWDQMIRHRFAIEIEEEIKKAGCVLVFWSEASRRKDTVCDEVRLAEKNEVPVVSVTLDGSDAAYGFGGYSNSDLSAWDERQDHRDLKTLINRINAVVPTRNRPKRPASLTGLDMPCLFLSTSSFETQLKPSEAVKALNVSRYPTLLVSAWDLVPRRRPEQLRSALEEYRKNGGFVLVDSGNYEASRLTNKRWKPSDLAAALSNTSYDWIFCFDDMRPSKKPDVAARSIINAVERDRSATSLKTLPVVHAPKKASGGHDIEILIDTVVGVAQGLQPELIGIPERELGAGLLQRCRTMMAIRARLGQLPFYQPVHLLGTGNPWSIAILTAAGADTFDGLEWCRVVVDMEHDRLHHFQHYDFFNFQTGIADSPVTRAAFLDDKIDFAGKVAFHNIDYYSAFMRELRSAISNNRLEAFVAERIGKAAAQQLNREVEGLFR
ncbi:TIR domain-containing protein [Mesorhizobium sp. M0715]|uniref:TIR domain-containing protein n=1 Tax=Mesorhizobium sp. M0715 TaxID=2956990 RepID=UPI0033399227